MVSMPACYRGGPGLKSRQGRVYFQMILNIILIYRRFLCRYRISLPFITKSSFGVTKWGGKGLNFFQISSIQLLNDPLEQLVLKEVSTPQPVLFLC